VFLEQVDTLPYSKLI